MRLAAAGRERRAGRRLRVYSTPRMLMAPLATPLLLLVLVLVVLVLTPLLLLVLLLLVLVLVVVVVVVVVAEGRLGASDNLPLPPPTSLPLPPIPIAARAAVESVVRSGTPPSKADSTASSTVRATSAAVNKGRLLVGGWG